jgi:DNA-binding response OmpR family regulator
MPKKVLIIDDEMDSCHLLKAFLTTLGFEVYIAFTLKEGLRLIDTISPCIIFLDNNLPDGLGWEHIDFIRSQLPDCKINLISAYEYNAHKLNGTGVEVLEKPISLSKLRSYLV